MDHVEQFNLYGFTPSVARFRCTFLASKENAKNLSLMCFHAFVSHGCLTNPFLLLFCACYNIEDNMANILNIL